ncbi:cytochrome c oxidase assembly protein, partial [Marinobacter alexandrii]
NQQPLAAGESTEMPLVFIVDRDLPEHITKLTLSYTLYDQSKTATVSDMDRPITTTNENG